MTPILPGPLGPASSWNALKAFDPFSDYRTVDELFRYDEWGIDVGRLPDDGRAWIRSVVDSIPAGIDGRLRQTTHWLAFPDEAAALATIHDGMITTRASYDAALDMVVEERSWLNPAHGVAEDCRIRYARLAIAEIDEDDLPYPQLRPGRAMLFGPSASPWKPGSFKLDGLHRWPLRRDVVLRRDGAPRCWLHRPDEQPEGSAEVLIETIALEEPDRVVVHRLRLDDEASAVATLSASGAPTDDTYRLATSVVRQQLRATPEGTTLEVEPVDRDALPDDEKPEATIQ